MKGNIILLRKPQFIQYKWLLLSVVLALAVLSYFCLRNENNLTMLFIDGVPFAVVDSETQVQEVLGKVQLDLENQTGMKILGFDNRISYDAEPVSKDSVPYERDKLYVLLRDELNWQYECWALKISGKPDLYFPSQEEANLALTKIKEYYLPKSQDKEIEQVTFMEEVRVAADKAPADSILTADAAVEIMVKGLNKIVQHTVKKGDTLWAISRDNSMTVDELKEINPDLKSDFLKLGQKLNLVKAEPLLTVMATYKTTVEEKIDYKTTYESDDTLWRGQQKVKQNGEYGKREVTYRISQTNEQEINRETLAEKIILEPISRIVIQGTKRMVASRGDGGNGALAWPLRGRITCAYGRYRTGGVHRGLDIDGVVGDPVFSAGDGVVLEARYQGSYGKCIIVDHGDGLSTLYGHLDQYKVSTGQKVSRGDLLGTVGVTGRTTGSHLHFEVRVNGQHQNPMNYLD